MSRRQLDTYVSEDELLEQVRAVARLNGWLTYHTHDSRRSERGFPDLVMVRRGRLVAAELKSERGLLTPDQHAWLTALARVETVEAHVWKPRDWPEVAVALERERDQ